MSNVLSASAPEAKPTQPPMRRRANRPSFRLTAAARGTSVEAMAKLTEREAVQLFAQARWGSSTVMPCPHCGTLDKHYWRARELRWKCKGCDKTFSVTSQTVLHDRKMPLRTILVALLGWANASAGKAATAVSLDTDVAYTTAFTLIHKMREGLVRTFNVGLLTGDIEADGSHRAGWNAAGKRGRPQVSLPYVPGNTENKGDAAQVPREALLTQSGRQRERARAKAGGRGEYGNRLHRDRRILMVVRARSGVRGRGALQTRVAMAKGETDTVAEAVAEAFIVLPESALNTDGSPAYTRLGARANAHRTVEHAKELVGPNGENCNLAESFAARIKVMEKGTHRRLTPKYLLDYSAEAAFREDSARLPAGARLKALLAAALTAGPSLFWRGYTRGRHRDVELLVTGMESAPPSGPRKGRHPNSQVNGRPPR